MGGEREDTDASPTRGTDQGSKNARSAEATTEPAPVDFDALHAALGDLPRVDDRASSSSHKAAADSHGRSNAAYASAKPHPIPTSKAPQDDPDAPAVIIAVDDTIPVAPPKMTVPLGTPPPPPVEVAASSPPPAYANPPSAHPSQAPAQAVPYPAKPYADRPRDIKMTMPMPTRPRRPRSATVVVRRREPSGWKKVAVFLGMLVLLLASGIAVVAFTNPDLLPWLTHPQARATASVPPPVTATATAPAATSAASPDPSASHAAASSGAAPLAAASASTGAPAGSTTAAPTASAASPTVTASASAAPVPTVKKKKPLPPPSTASTASVAPANTQMW